MEKLPISGIVLFALAALIAVLTAKAWIANTEYGGKLF